MEGCHNMDGNLRFSFEELAVIDGVISGLYPRMSGDDLKKTYHILHQHLQEGFVNRIDLQRIESALALAAPGGCTACNKEAYRELTTIRLKTQAMLVATA